MIKESEYNCVVDYAEQQSLNGLWASYIAPNMFPSLKLTGNEIPFEKRKELFFYFVHRLLKEGRLKLVNN